MSARRPVSSLRKTYTTDADTLVSTYQHIHPMFDGREHICLGFTCWCNPHPDAENPSVIIHNPQVH